MRVKPPFIFALLVSAFLLYSFSLYTSGAAPNAGTAERKLASEGRLVWQKYNCQACHQLYGLGGYLGPDLTNVCSAKGKGPRYIKAMVACGTAQMPSFSLSEEEEAALVAFLSAMDKTGTADPSRFRATVTGMIEPE